MSITPADEQWLLNAGYRYHCFISWPHIVNDLYVTQCARQVKREIEQFLTLFNFSKPAVFIDETGIPGGARWAETLRSALCTSATMVAICHPMYYHPSHKWCGLEWSAMATLGEQRLAGSDRQPIIPLIIRARKDDPLPPAVKATQYYDLSKVTIRGTSYYKTPQFRRDMSAICGDIEAIALALVQNRSTTDCVHFQIPAQSAFADYAPGDQPDMMSGAWVDPVPS